MNSKLPLVSIITPSWNSAQFLDETIRSVLQQDYPCIEHIVVDGGSTDGTVDILGRYSSVTWISEPDKGQSDALNKGFAMAQGDIIGWLNADDTYEPGAISTAVDFLLTHKEVNLVYSDCNVIDEDGRIQHTEHPEDFALERQVIRNSIPQPTVFMKNDFLQRLGGVDVSLHYVMDYDLWLRAGLVGGIKKMPSVILANFRICSGTKTAEKPEQFFLEKVRVIDKFFSATGTLPPGIRSLETTVRARTHWQAGLELLAKAEIAAGRFHKDRAVKLGVFDRDEEFAIKTLLETALDFYPSDKREYIDLVLRDSNPKLRRRVLSHYCAAMAFRHRDSGRNIAVLRYIGLCLGSDPKWLKNRGLRSIGFRTLLAMSVVDHS
jgi:glycosyltransferase involved in cell wall biosynthesis